MANDAMLPLIAKLENQLPPELVAQLKMPAQQAEFQLTADAAVEKYFDTDVQTSSGSTDVVQAEKDIASMFGENIQTEEQKQAALAARAKSSSKSIKAKTAATPWAPTIPRRYSFSK